MTDSTSETADDEPTESCACCSPTEGSTGETPSTGRWIANAPVLEAELPVDVGVGLGRLLGEEPIGTIGEWVRSVRRHTGGGAIDVADLCHATAETGHVGTVERDGETETYHFRCFYDAVVLSVLLDRPVDVRTESPEGTEIRARALGTGSLTVTPPGAVFSFGVDAGVRPPSDEGPTAGDVYGAICPYVQAFPDRDAYRQWARTVPAATVAMPLSGATDLAAALVE